MFTCHVDFANKIIISIDAGRRRPDLARRQHQVGVRAPAVAPAVRALERALGALLTGVTVSAALVHPVYQHGVVKAQTLEFSDYAIYQIIVSCDRFLAIFWEIPCTVMHERMKIVWNMISINAVRILFFKFVSLSISNVVRVYVYIFISIRSLMFVINTNRFLSYTEKNGEMLKFGLFFFWLKR